MIILEGIDNIRVVFVDKVFEIIFNYYFYS